MIRFSHKGDFSKATHYFEQLGKVANLEQVLNKYGQMGVSALASATPTNTGLTAASWYYEIERQNGGATLSFKNSNTNKGVNIAIIIQYGHGTGTGGWVQGRDYINPAIQPVFDKIADDAWGEVTKI